MLAMVDLHGSGIDVWLQSVKRVRQFRKLVGARGRLLLGRGAGINEQEKIFGMSIEPEKEVVLTLTYSDVDTILEEIVRAADLNETGRGIAFVVPVDRVVGVAHFMKQSPERT